MINHPRILWLHSAPLVALDGSPLDALDLEAERNAIVRELAACNKEILLRIRYATVDELVKSIEEGFNILHLSGHGHEEFLLFEDGKGGSQPVRGDYLRRLIRMGGPFELAIVSACNSGRIGEMLVEAGIPHVVAIKCDLPVLDQAAIVLTGQFFRSLFRGDSVRKAFEIAKLLVEGSPELMKMKSQLRFIAYNEGIPFVPEEKKFVLLPKGAAHASPLLSEEVPQGTLVVEEPALPQSTLPVKPQTFTGRSTEMYDIINELLENRLVTITGAGGIGKTMVAIEVARWFFSRSHFHDGIYYIDLRQTDTVEGVIDIIGATLGVQPAELTNIISHLRKRHCLLVLDNAEDILWQDEDAVQELIDTVLKATLNTKLLITSQRPVGGNLYEPEYVYRIYPLEQEDAAHLFLLTAKRRIAKEEWASDTFYCLLEQLGGHPLSIVLTACQLTPGIDLEDLTKRINLYKARAITVRDITDRDAEHGESLVASLASAYDELCSHAKTLFGVLSLLPAGAREGMLTDIFGDTAWECVHELNEASLVEIRTRRATLLPPVRLFAMSVTAESIKAEYGPKVLEVLGHYTRKLYEYHSTKYAKEYRLSFTADEPNLRSAVDLPCAPPQSVHEHSALGILGPRLIYLYILHNRWKEAKEVGRRILSSLNQVKDQLGEADTLLMMGMLAVQSGDFEKARLHYQTALTIYQQIDHKLGEANMFWKLGELIMLSGDFEKARSHYERALTIYQHIGKRISEAHTLVYLADLIMLSGDLDEARSHYETALTIYQEIEYSLGEANTLKRLGDLAVQTGDFEKARPHYETAITIYRNIDDKTGEASAYILLGQWAALTDQVKCAESFLDSGFTICREIDYLDGLADAHMVKAFILLKHHHFVNAAYELDCCSSIQDKIHAYSKAVPWLILYAVHLRSHEFEEGVKLCLKYAEEFASKAQNQCLQNQVNEQLREAE